MAIKTPCPDCNSSGLISETKVCSRCRGYGQLETSQGEAENLEIKPQVPSHRDNFPTDSLYQDPNLRRLIEGTILPRRVAARLVSTASIYAAYVAYLAGSAHEAGGTAKLFMAIAGWAAYGFVQGFLPILNFLAYPALGYFGFIPSPHGYALGLLAFLLFYLCQYRPNG